MSKLTVLKNARDIKIDKKNQFLKKKWIIEDKISKINKDKISYQFKSDYSSIGDANLSVKKLKVELKRLNIEIIKINEELSNLNDQIEDEEILELNSKFINDKNLHYRQVNQMLDNSRDLSKKYESTIKDYSEFLRTLNSFLNEIYDDSYYDYLNQMKIKVEAEKEELLSCKEKCIEFEHLNALKKNLINATYDLENMESDFSISKVIIKDFNSVIKDSIDFTNNLDSKMGSIDDRFLYPDLNEIQIELQNKIRSLSDYKKQCLKLNNLDDLNESIENSKIDLAKIKIEFNRGLNKSKNLFMKFERFMEYYKNFLISFDTKLQEVDEKFWFDDFEQMRREIESKLDGLLHFNRLCVENNRLDDFEEVITNTKNDLIKMRLDFNQKIEKSKILSDKFYHTIDDYYVFISKLNSDLEEIDDEFLVDVFNQMIVGAKSKVDDLLEYQEIYEYKRLDDLNEVVDIANTDLVKIKDNFTKVINSELNELVIEAKSIIEGKSAPYSKLNLRLSNLIDKTDKLNDAIDKQELLDNLIEIKVNFDNEFENLNNIEKELSDVTQNSMDIQLINNESDKVNNLINQLNEINIENHETIIIEEEKTYNELLNLDELIDSKNVENLLYDLNKCFNMPMFKRQLKRYNLNDDELNRIKEDVRLDIINHVIGEDENLKTIIKIRCGEYRKSHLEIDDDEINDLLNNIDVEGINDEVIDECKNKVKQDFIEGNISLNNAELKFKNYVSKKINESNQLKELEYIKDNPNVPSIKVHLTQGEVDEIYVIAENEIISEYGIRGNVETRIYNLVNKKIKENQSEARGRLNVIKRDLPELTQLTKKRQVDFIHQIEFYINTNDIKYYDISEEYVTELIYDFINYGKIRLG